MTSEEQQLVRIHVRHFMTRLGEVGVGNLDAFRQTAAGYALDPSIPEGVGIEEIRIAGVSCILGAPHNEVAGRVVVHAHGGGFTFGDRNSHGALISRLALATQSRVIMPLYRLAPEHRFPAAHEDFFAVYAKLAQAMPRGSVVLAGDSAGGGLAIGAALMARERRIRRPAALVCLSPFADMTCSGASYRECATTDPVGGREFSLFCSGQYLAGHDPCDSQVSPVFANFATLPPMLIQASSVEVLRDDSIQLAERARAAGVPVDLQLWPDMVHVWHFFAPLLPEANEALAKIGGFVERVVTEDPHVLAGDSGSPG